MSIPGPQFEISPLRGSSVQHLHMRRDEIDMDPPYQRQGEVWTKQRRQLLVDSILNDFDVPKFYLHQYSSPARKGDRIVRYALVDGKQRLDAIFSFLDGDLEISQDFVHISSGDSAAAGATFADLKELNPLLAGAFQAFTLDVVVIKTDEVEMIEEMFSRLNEAVPLNAAEKRNALGGPLPVLVREISRGNFFERNLPFTNRRYRHYDLAAKFLYWAHEYSSEGIDSPIARDVKKARLDDFFTEAKEAAWPNAKSEVLRGSVERTLGLMSECFGADDELLRNIGMVSVYFLLWHRNGALRLPLPSRVELSRFEEDRRGAAKREGDKIDEADLVYAEFARLSQSPNDGGALARRLEILDAWLKASRETGDPRPLLKQLYLSAR